MLFVDLLHSVTPDEVSAELVERFEMEADNVEAHMGAFYRMLTLQPITPDFVIVVKRYTEEDDGENPGIDVGGRVEGSPHGWGLEFRPWPQWLGAPIESDLPPVATVAECLYEMTFVGYDEQEIQEQWDAVVSLKEEYEEAKADGIIEIIGDAEEPRT